METYESPYYSKASVGVHEDDNSRLGGEGGAAGGVEGRSTREQVVPLVPSESR